MQESTFTPTAPTKRRSSTILLTLLALVLGIMLFAGMQPYANYKDNWVSFTPQTNETTFGKYGIAIGDMPEFVEQAARNDQLQILITPIISEPPDERFHVFAQFDSPDSDTPLIFGQWKSSLIAINGHDRRNEFGFSRISANLSRHYGVPAEVLYTFGRDKSVVEIDGRFEAEGPAFKFSDPLTRISIGNSPDGKFGWYGSIASIKFIDAANPSNAITYRFDKDTLPEIQADTLIASDTNFALTVPAPGGYPDKSWIGNMNIDQLLDNNLTDIFVNFLGFAPFGFLLTALLMTGAKRIHWALSIAITILVGFLISFGIESIQTVIPGRSSHMHDLLLNTSGTLLGSIGFLILAAFWKAFNKPKVDIESVPTDANNILAQEDMNIDRIIESNSTTHIDLGDQQPSKIVRNK